MPPYSFRNVWTSFLNRQFAPSAATLNYWIGTRKDPQMMFPGLLNTFDVDRDRKMFWTAFALELGSAIPLIIGAFLLDEGLIYPLLALSGTVIGFVFDVRIGILLRRNDIENRLIRAQLKIASILGLSPAAVGQLKATITNANHTIIDIVLYVAIYLIAALKIFVMYIFFPTPLFWVPFGFLYCFIAYIHIKHSGYKIQFDRFKKSLVSDYDAWVKAGGIAGAPVTSHFNFRHQGANHTLSYSNFMQDSDGLVLAGKQSFSGNFAVVRDYVLAAQIQQITGLVIPVNSNNSDGNGAVLDKCTAIQGVTLVAQLD